MNTTPRYTVLIFRGRSGHIAFTPKFPEVVGHGRGRNAAHKDFKARLERHIIGLLDRGIPVPRDDIVSVKYVKMDLHALQARTNLV